MGKKRKALLDLRRFGKVRRKWETKFANFLEANLETIREKVESVTEKVEEILIQVEEPQPPPEPVVEEEPKPVKRKRTTTKKTTTTTKKPASTTRRRRTTKTKKESRMNPDSNPAQSCGSPISLNNKPGSYGKQNPKLLNISGVSKQRRKTKTRPSENSPQSIGGVRTVRGLEFLNRL